MTISYFPVSDLRDSKLMELDNLLAPNLLISYSLVVLVVNAVTVIPNLAAY
jgi:hypothetical protein